MVWRYRKEFHVGMSIAKKVSSKTTEVYEVSMKPLVDPNT